MISFAIFLIRILKKPIEWLGVDFIQFETLLRTKLTLDFRSGPSAFQSTARKKQSFGKQLFIFVVFGLLIGFLSLSIGDLLLSMTLFFTVIMVMLAMTLITEFTTVLFDPRDNQILLPRPVNNRTLLLLRLTHVQFYIGYIALSLSLATGVIVAVKYNATAVLLYFLAVGLGTWMTLAFTTFFYLLISKIVNPERFKDILTYLQIIFAIVIFAGYQLVPKLIDEEAIKSASLAIHGFLYLFPPVWLAGLVKLSQIPNISTPEIILSVLGIIIPVTAAFILVKFLSNRFEIILGEGSTESAAPVNKKSENRKFTDRIINFFCISTIEEASWKMAVSTTKRDRKFKEAVYPQLGMLIVFSFMILRPDLKDPAASLKESAEFLRYLFLIIIGFAGGMASLQLPYTDTPEAAWIYRALPVSEHGQILTGAIKSMIMRFYIPLFLIVAIPSVWFWGVGMVPQIVLSGCGIIMLLLLVIMLQGMELPFTQPREMQRKGANTITAILSMILMGIFSGVVYGTTFIPLWATLILIMLFGSFTLMLFKNLRKRKI
jgi:hypothetical protein